MIPFVRVQEAGAVRSRLVDPDAIVALLDRLDDGRMSLPAIVGTIVSAHHVDLDLLDEAIRLRYGEALAAEDLESDLLEDAEDDLDPVPGLAEMLAAYGRAA